MSRRYINLDNYDFKIKSGRYAGDIVSPVSTNDNGVLICEVQRTYSRYGVKQGDMVTCEIDNLVQLKSDEYAEHLLTAPADVKQIDLTV